MSSSESSLWLTGSSIANPFSSSQEEPEPLEDEALIQENIFQPQPDAPNLDQEPESESNHSAHEEPQAGDASPPPAPPEAEDEPEENIRLLWGTNLNVAQTMESFRQFLTTYVVDGYIHYPNVIAEVCQHSPITSQQNMTTQDKLHNAQHTTTQNKAI